MGTDRPGLDLKAIAAYQVSCIALLSAKQKLWHEAAGVGARPDGAWQLT